jgi:hypothetical protein
MAGFEVITYGRFWVIAKGQQKGFTSERPADECAGDSALAEN